MNSTFELLLLITFITTTITATFKEKKQFYNTRQLSHELQVGKRSILALGLISTSSSTSSLTLFTSGLTGRTNLTGGYQVDLFGYQQKNTTSEPPDGHFLLNSSSLVSLSERYPRAISDSSLIRVSGMQLFLVSEARVSAGTSLLVISESSASALKITSKTNPTFTTLPLAGNPFRLQLCYAGAAVHLSTTSDEPLTYYIIYPSSHDGSGNSIDQMKLYGGGGEVSKAEACNVVGSLGKLCILDGGKKISLSKTEGSSQCYGSSTSVLNRLAAGYVGTRTVYLVDIGGKVYLFDRSLLKSSGSFASTKFISVSRERMWKTWPPRLSKSNNGSAEKIALDPHFTTNVIIAGCTYLLLIFMSIGGCLLYYLHQRRQWKCEEKERKWRASRDRELAQQILAMRRLKRMPSDSDSEDSIEDKKKILKKVMVEKAKAKNKTVTELEVKSTPAVDIYAVYAANKASKQQQKLNGIDRRSRMLSLKRTVLPNPRQSPSFEKQKRKLKKVKQKTKFRGGDISSFGGACKSKRVIIKSKSKSKTHPRRGASSGPNESTASFLVKKSRSKEVEDKSYCSFSS